MDCHFINTGVQEIFYFLEINLECLSSHQMGGKLQNITGTHTLQEEENCLFSTFSLIFMCWIMSLQKICWSQSLAPQNLTYLEIWSCSGNQVKMRPLAWALIQCDWCTYKKGKLGHRHVHKVKAEIRVIPLQAKQCKRLPANHQELEERHGTDSHKEPIVPIP